MVNILAKGRLSCAERRPFALQFMVFCNAVCRLLQDGSWGYGLSVTCPWMLDDAFSLNKSVYYSETLKKCCTFAKEFIQAKERADGRQGTFTCQLVTCCLSTGKPLPLAP